MIRWLAAALCLLAAPALAATAVGVSMGFPAGTPAPPSGLALTRTFNNPLGTTSSSSAFEMRGEPFKAWPNAAVEVPPGNAVTAAWQTAGVPARIGVCQRKYDASGNLSWAQIMVDATTAAIPSGSNDTLVFSSAAGAFGNTTVVVSAESAGTFTLASGTLEAGFAQRPIEFTGSLGGLAGFSLNHLYYAYYASATTFTLWTEAGVQITPTGTYTSGLSINLDTSARTDADWEALGDTIVISNVTTFSTGGANMNAGPYTATFDGGATNTVTVLCTSPVGREVQVAATLVNSGAVAHCYLKAMMDYWVPQTATGTAGPIESIPSIENMQIWKGTADGCSGAPGEFTADLAWKRGGTTMRQFVDVPIPAATAASLARQDGDWDYASNDPGFVVTQDYTLVDATYKTPSYTHGIVYDGVLAKTFPALAISAVNTTTGLFSTATGGNFITTNPVSAVGGGVVGGFPTIPISIKLTGVLSGLTGISVCDPTVGPCVTNTIYWTCLKASGFTSFWLYDTEQHAYACVAGAGNGQIIPSGTYGGSGLSAGMAVAPETNGAYQSWDAGGTGGRPDLNLFGEWGTAYLLYSGNTYSPGNTYLFQAMAREQAYALTSAPEFAVDKTTNRPISFLDAAHTPTALGTAKTTSWYECDRASTDINGGVGPTGNGTFEKPDAVCGLWQLSSSDHAAGNPGYIVWLLEGNPYLQRLGMIYGNEGLMTATILGDRNAHNTQVGSGTTYYAVPNNPTVSKGARGNAWQARDEGIGGFMAPDGSAEEQIARTELSNWAASFNGYYAWKATGGTTDWQKLGLFSPDDEGNGVIATMLAPYTSNFMNAFGTMTAGLIEGIHGDFLSSFNTFAQNLGAFQAQALGDTANYCPFFADSYNLGLQKSETGTTPPGVVISTINGMGAGSSEDQYTFAGTTVSVYSSARVPLAAFNEAGGTSAPLSPGDQYRPFSESTQIGDNYVAPPSPLVMGTDYPILTVSGTTATLNNGSGSPITFPPGPGAQQTITNATWVSNIVAVTTALNIGYNTSQSSWANLVAGMTPTSLNGIFSAAIQSSVTAASWAANQVTFTVSSLNVPIVPGDTFRTAGFVPSASGYNGTFTAAAGTGGNTVIAALLTNPGTFTTNGVVVYPINEFTYTVAGSGTPTFAGATEAPFDGGVLIPSTYKGANCPATGGIHSGPAPGPNSYMDQVRAGVCEQANVQAAQGLGTSTWGAACTNALGRMTGTGFNGLAEWDFQGSP